MKMNRSMKLYFLMMLTFVLAFTPVWPTFAASSSNGKPAHSTYDLKMTLPDVVQVNTEVGFDVTLTTAITGSATYGNVQVNLHTEGPGNAAYTVTYDGHAYTFENGFSSGNPGIQLKPDVNLSQPANVTFSATGTYRISLILESRDGTLIARADKTVLVLLAQSGYTVTAGLPAQVGAGDYVETSVTLATYALGMNGIPGARWRVTKSAGDGQLLLQSSGANGDPVTYLDSGEWPFPGMNVPAQHNSTTLWTVKASKTGTYTLRFELLDANGQPVASDEKTVEAVPRFENLGTQVYNQLLMRGQLGKENGRDVIYSVLAGEVAQFVVADVKSEELLKQIPVEGAGGAWGIAVATDGKVYIGTYGAAWLYVYDPAAGTVTNLGDPASVDPNLPKSTQFLSLVSGKDGKVYGGVYPNGIVFEYDPAKGFTSLGQPYPGTEYPETVVFDEKQNILYAGGGGQKAYLTRIDLNTGEKTNILPDVYADKHTFVTDLTLIDDRLYLKFDNGTPVYQMIVMDKNTLQVYLDNDLVHSRSFVKSPTENKAYFTYGGILKTYNIDTNTVEPVTVGGKPVNLFANAIGWGFVELNEPDYPGYTLLGYGGNQAGYFFKFNLQTGNLKLFNMPLPKQAFGLHTIGKGPDGKIYSNGYLQGGIGIFNPANRKAENYAFPQSEGMASLGQYMYFGTYPGAKIHQYDTTKVFKPSGSGRTVNQVFELKTTYEQDRPWSMVGVPEEQKLLIGTVPDYGKYGGALTVYEPSKPAPNYEVYRNIVPNHSIVALAYKDGLVYGGSSYRGGLGSEDRFDDARLFIFDLATRQKVFETIPFPGKGAITSLIQGPDGNIWGFAMGTFFIFDPNTRQIIYSNNAFPEAFAEWRDAQMEISRKDGHVYGTIAGKFFRIDKDSKQITVLQNEKANRLAQDNDGNFYFADYVNLWRYTVEDKTVKVTGVRFNSDQLTMGVGLTQKLIATVMPQIATLKNVTWSTNNSTVATVDANGNVKALNPGQATITVKTEDGGKLAHAIVTVNP
jgi:hypothetical protein